MAETPDDEPLKQLDARIAEAKKAIAPKPRKDDHYSQASIGWRMVTELVAGIGIGFGIGYGLDTLFGTRPLLMVLFILLGLAAGVKTMLRTAAELERSAGTSARDEGE